MRYYYTCFNDAKSKQIKKIKRKKKSTAGLDFFGVNFYKLIQQMHTHSQIKVSLPAGGLWICRASKQIVCGMLCLNNLYPEAQLPSPTQGNEAQSESEWVTEALSYFHCKLICICSQTHTYTQTKGLQLLKNWLRIHFITTECVIYYPINCPVKSEKHVFYYIVTPKLHGHFCHT